MAQVVKEERRLLAVTSDGLGPVWSPDGNSLAYSDYARDRSFESDQEVFVVAADGGNGLAAWSPDGSRIAFSDSGDSESDSEIFVVDADGGNLRQLTGNDVEDHVLAWS